MAEENNNLQEALQNGGAEMPNDGNDVLLYQENEGGEQYNIAESIEGIIQERHAKAIGVKRKIDHLKALKSELVEYNRLRGQIIDRNGNFIDDGPFAAIIRNNPDMKEAVRAAECSELEAKIDEQIKVLERLHKRFTRKTISIQIFGLAGNGKSRFIQTISGLNNETVLTSEHDHTTGATTYIQNDSKFKARIYGYTEKEFIALFNRTLQGVLKACGKPEALVHNMAQIERFQLADYGLDGIKYEEEVKPLTQYIGDGREKDSSISHIKAVLEDIKENGIEDFDEIVEVKDGNVLYRKYIEKTNPAEVQEYIAHHNGYEEDNPLYREHKKYMAVKFVRLFNPFTFGDASKIELMDTVGLGNAATSDLVLRNMYDSVEANSDIVVQIYCPPADATWRGSFKQSKDLLRDIHYSNNEHKIERIPNDALFFVVNEKVIPNSDNTDKVKEVISKWTNSVALLHASCADKNDVRKNVMRPILESLVKEKENGKTTLEEIDDAKAAYAKSKGEHLFTEFTTFMSLVADVLLADPNIDIDTIFEENFKYDLLPTLRNALKKKLQEAKINHFEPSYELEQKLLGICNSTNREVIMNRYQDTIKKSLRINPHPVDAFFEVAGEIRHDIPTLFRSIDIELQEQVEKRKAEIFDTFYNEGLFSRIMQKPATEEKTEYLITNQWMNLFLEQLIGEKDFERLNEVLKTLLTFNINTEGFLLQHVQRHLEVFNQQPQIPIGEEEAAIKFYLSDCLDKAFDGYPKDDDSEDVGITQDLSSFIQEPNEAIYYALEELVFNVIYNTKTEMNLRKFYARHKIQIWSAFNDVKKSKASFQQWQQQMEKLNVYNIPNNF